jgi:hypothetical protein
VVSNPILPTFFFCRDPFADFLTVEVIREEFYEGVIPYTTIITAPWSPQSGYTNWTCRASHITTWYPLPTLTGTLKRAVVEAEATPSSTPESGRTSSSSFWPTSTTSVSTVTDLSMVPRFDDSDADTLAELEQLFDLVSDGLRVNDTTVIGKEQYLNYFNATDTQTPSVYGQSVLDKFRMHDINDDGLLMFEEIQLHCDEDGCD